MLVHTLPWAASGITRTPGETEFWWDDKSHWLRSHHVPSSVLGITHRINPPQTSEKLMVCPSYSQGPQGSEGLGACC